MPNNVTNGPDAAKAYCPSCAAKPVMVSGVGPKVARRPVQGPAQPAQGFRPGMAVRVIRPGSF